MQTRRNALLADMGREASLERSDFLVRAGEQLQRFMTSHANRIRALGGITLIDDDEDFLAVAPDGTFRSRSRVYDEAKGQWVTETEVIETAAELAELYNPADILQAFADADDSRIGATDAEGTTADDGAEAGSSAGTGATAKAKATGADPYAAAADTWAAGQPDVPQVRTEADAAAALYDLALEFQERSQRAESGLIESFENAASGLLSRVGSVTVVDDDDEHLTLGVGGFKARVIPEGEAGWRELSEPEDIVQFYDPTDVFGDLA
ncbi:MAG TPA: hypothetical protein VF484_08300, partial [Candidatus Limnocylindrales bacterium]